jgi:hypothetical protein
LNRYAENRGLENFFLQNMPQNDLFNFFNKSRALIILPVRFDTFNLVALEAIMNGCPMAISTNAGICDYLDEEYPFVPYIKFKNTDFFHSIKQMEDVLSNYDFYKKTLIDHVKVVRNSFVPNLKNIKDMIRLDESKQIWFQYKIQNILLNNEEVLSFIKGQNVTFNVRIILLHIFL